MPRDRPSLPRPRSQLPILRNFTLPLPNTDEFYFSQQLWDPLTKQPLVNEFGPAPIVTKGRSKSMPPKQKATTTKGRKKKDQTPNEPLGSSQVDQLESDGAQEAPTKPVRPPKYTVKMVTAPRAPPKAATSTTSKRKRSPTPPDKDDKIGKHGLERFRCPVKGDGTPSSEVMNQSELPLKRRRPPKELATEKASVTEVRRHNLHEEEEDEVPIPEKKRQKQEKTKAKGKERKKLLEPEPIFFLGEIDEDGNPIESPASDHHPPSTCSQEQRRNSTASTSPSPRKLSRSPNRSPLRPVSPSKRTASSASFSSHRIRKVGMISPFRPPLRSSTVTAPQQKETASSPFRPARTTSPRQPNHESLPLSSSSPSNVLPSQMAKRIKSSHEMNPDHPSPGRSAGLDAAVPPEADGDLTLVGLHEGEEGEEEAVLPKRKSGLSVSDQLQLEETLKSLNEVAGFDYADYDDLSIDGDEAVVNEDSGKPVQTEEEDRILFSRSLSPVEQLLHGAPSPPQPQPRRQNSSPPELFSSRRASPVPPPPPVLYHSELFEPSSLSNRNQPPLPPPPTMGSNSSHRRRIESTSDFATTTLNPQLFSVNTVRSKPTPTHRLVPLNLKGLTTMVQDLVETCLKSSQPLSKFGLNDNNDEDQQDGDNEFGRGEIGFLRREVNRLTGELVRKDETISNLSEQLRKESFAKDKLREELDELDRMLIGVEEERDREKEKVGWMKEMKKGLIRDLRELETRCEELEKRHRSEGAEDGVEVETETVGETNEDSEEGNRNNEDTLNA